MNAGSFMRDIVEIISLVLGVAFIALLVGNADKTATVISAGGDAFNSILGTIINPGNTYG